MKKSIAMLGVSLLTFILIVALTLPAFAQEQEPEPADFGQKDWAYTWLGASDFMQNGVSNRSWNVGGYYGRGPDSGNLFVATIKLPSGSEIKRVLLYAFDDHPTSNISWNVVRNWTDLHGQAVTIFDGPSFGAEGYGFRFYDPVSFTFDNYHQYTISVIMPQLNVHHKLKGVRIAYQRQISAAPLTATFSDVPVGSTFHQHIEALARSGITGGVGGGLYAPSDYVTRGQMAAFLSRALGLHHLENAF